MRQQAKRRLLEKPRCAHRTLLTLVVVLLLLGLGLLGIGLGLILLFDLLLLRVRQLILCLVLVLDHGDLREMSVSCWRAGTHECHGWGTWRMEADGERHGGMPLFDGGR